MNDKILNSAVLYGFRCCGFLASEIKRLNVCAQEQDKSSDVKFYFTAVGFVNKYLYILDTYITFCFLLSDVQTKRASIFV